MKRKIFSCLMFSALIGAGMVSVTSCADYDEDIRVLSQQVNENEKIQTALQNQVNGMQNQIKALEEALAAMKSCQCGDVDARIAAEISKALAGLNYTTPEEVAAAIQEALKGINTGLTAEEVQALIDAYHAAHPGCQCGDIKALIEQYLKENPGLSEADVEAIVKAYHDAHPQSTLTENDVKSIVETYINQLQHFTKEQIEGMIQTAITQALANYYTKSETYSKSEIDALLKKASDDVSVIASTVIEQYMKDHPYTLDTEAVKAIADSAIENSEIIINLRTAVNNLQTTVNNIQTELNNLKNNVYTKDQVYTKTEVTNLINTLIQQALAGLTPGDNTTLSTEQLAIVNQLIETAINNYNSTHPNCNCQYDAAAFQALVDQVAANTAALGALPTDIVTGSQLEAAINAVKDLIPAAPDLSNYVTVATLNAAIAEVNGSIATAQGLAEQAKSIADQALAKAEANEILINNLQTSVTELNNLYLSLADKLDDAAKKAETAFNRSLSNYFEIQSLKNLYQQLLNKVNALEEKGYDDTELRGRIEALESQLTTIQTQLANAATKAELEAAVNELKGLVNEAKTYADNAAATAAANALKDAKAYTDAEIKKIKDLYGPAISGLETRVSTLETKVGAIETRLTNLENEVKEIKKVTDYVKKLITNIELQGTKNPAFGYYSLPVGLTSNVLLAYYGEASDAVKFPAMDDYKLVYDNEENWITPEDFARIGFNPNDKNQAYLRNGGTTLMGSTGNAGKLYLTVNPSSVDFTGTQFKLVNSLGEESPVLLGDLQKSTDKLTFGQTRATVAGENANNGFYEATATVTKPSLDAVKFGMNKQLEDAIEEVAKEKLGANLTNLVQALYNQFNGRLDAYAVQASWSDELGTHTVTSQYGIAATALKPLGYGFLKGESFNFPYITPLSERGINLRDYIDLSKFNKTVSKDDLGISVKFDFADIWYDEATGEIKCDIEVTEKNKKYIEKEVVLVSASGVYTDPHTGVTKTFTGYASNKELAAFIASIVTASADANSALLAQEFDDNIEKLLNQINDILAPGGKLESTANNLLDKVQDKLNSLLGAADGVINQVNNLTDRLRRLLKNPNYYLQSVVAYPCSDGFYHPISNAKGMPTVVDGSTGEAMELWVTSLNAEIVVPAFKKYIAVTNVYKDGKDADTDAALMTALQKANSVEYFNEVFEGDRYGVVFTPDTSLSGATYEIAYSALDYFGNISQQKYYITVE